MITNIALKVYLYSYILPLLQTKNTST